MGVFVATVVLLLVVVVLFSCLFRDRVSRCGPDWPPTLDPGSLSLKPPGARITGVYLHTQLDVEF